MPPEYVDDLVRAGDRFTGLVPDGCQEQALVGVAARQEVRLAKHADRCEVIGQVIVQTSGETHVAFQYRDALLGGPQAESLFACGIVKPVPSERVSRDRGRDLHDEHRDDRAWLACIPQDRQG